MASIKDSSEQSALTPSNPYENVLRSAWVRLLMYDDASSSQKKRYQLTRRWVIALWFIASCIALMKAIVVFETLLGPPFGHLVEGFLQFLLVVVPAISVGIMTWGLQFANSIAWIEYRTSAEKIRSQIYLFRTNGGDYFEQNPEQQRDRLLAALNEADRLIPEGIGLPTTLLLPHDAKVQERLHSKAKDKASATEETDTFLNALSVKEYINVRLEKQIAWYAGRVSKDMATTERFQMFALTVAGLGAILAALGYGFEALVVLTTAGGVALSLWANIRMFGATYFIYRQTANDLQDELDRWNGLDDTKRTPEAGRRFIETAEKIFLRENEEWRKHSIQMQTANEQTLLKNMQLSGVKLPPLPGSKEAVAAAQVELGEKPPTPPSEVTPNPIVDGPSGVEPMGQPLLEPANMDQAEEKETLPTHENGANSPETP